MFSTVMLAGAAIEAPAVGIDAAGASWTRGEGEATSVTFAFDDSLEWLEEASAGASGGAVEGSMEAQREGISMIGVRRARDGSSVATAAGRREAAVVVAISGAGVGTGAAAADAGAGDETGTEAEAAPEESAG